MKHARLKLLGLSALVALFAACESDDYSSSGSVNFYGSVGYYGGFYDPWYGYGGGDIIVCPPDRPVGGGGNRPTVTPHMGGGGGRRR